MKDIEKTLRYVEDFPTLPTIYSALLDVIANPHSTVQDVADVISKDQSSALKILRTVNSSLFGLQTRVDTLSTAIFHLGFNEVKNLVVALSVIDLFSNMKSIQSFNIVDFWKHSIAVGVVSRIIGKTLGVKNLENFFLAGIIHDIGKLFFLKYFKEDFTKVSSIIAEENISIREAEVMVFGINHCVAGEIIAERWRLSSSIKNVIRNHTTGFVDGNFNTLCASVHIANIIARLMELGNPGDHLVPEPNFQIWKELNFPQDTFVKLHKYILQDYQQSASILLLS